MNNMIKNTDFYTKFILFVIENDCNLNIDHVLLFFI